MAMDLPVSSAVSTRMWSLLPTDTIEAVTPEALSPLLAVLMRSARSTSVSVDWTSIRRPLISKLPSIEPEVPPRARPRSSLSDAAEAVLSLCASATCSTSMVWLPVAAALVTLTPIRLPAAEGVPPALLLEAKTSFAWKILPAPPKVTWPRRAFSELLKVFSRPRSSSKAAILSVLSVILVSSRSTGMRRAAMMLSTAAAKSMPEPRPEKVTRPFSSTFRLLTLMFSTMTALLLSLGRAEGARAVARLGYQESCQAIP